MVPCSCFLEILAAEIRTFEPGNGPPMATNVFLFLFYFLARDSMLSALYAIARPSVCLSVCPSVCLSVRLSHGWISQKRLNVSSKFFHHLIGPTF